MGKRLPDAFYVHRSALGWLAPPLQACDRRACAAEPHLARATLVKFAADAPKLSYLFYPDFDDDPHPALQASWVVDLRDLSVAGRDYSQSENPFVLHRKETFLAPDDPRRESFAALTRAEERLGLLNESRAIGTRSAWERRLARFNVRVVGHRLEPRDGQRFRAIARPKIERHKAAIVRKALSKPVRLALEAGLLGGAGDREASPGETPGEGDRETSPGEHRAASPAENRPAGLDFFDYGCGYGSDVRLAAQAGFSSAGWDPYYQPEAARLEAKTVNLGYVINVIEDPEERRDALKAAWGLARQVLVVAAQVLVDSDRREGQLAYGDGIVTRRNTFQKYYEQEELKAYIDEVLGVDAIPAALGIYFVFRDERRAETFRASRFRSRASTPRVRQPVKGFEDYRPLLTPLMDFWAERGRLPARGELPEEAAIAAELGSLRRAFQVVLQATDRAEWEAIADRRRQELAMYLALTRFGQRPKLGQLSPVAQEDVKGLFGSYRTACETADAMLYGLGDPAAIERACRASLLGQQRPNSLWIHLSAFDRLDPFLRLYEGCASRTLGRADAVDVVKFHIRVPKISYFSVPDFDSVPHPPLRSAVEIDLRDLRARYRSFDPANPPLLHQKDRLVAPDYPHYEKFAKLTRQEEDWGLLDDLGEIYDRRGWKRRLGDRCATLQGHRLVWRKDADPYRLRLRKAEVRQRQRDRAARENLKDNGDRRRS